jgi:2'-5' RNA ligase
VTSPTRLTPLSDPQNVLFEEVAEHPGLTEVEAYALLAGADTSTFGVPKIIAAAAEVHTGAMIALLPSDADARRLALFGFEPPEQLHLTYVYLGDAADFTPAARAQIVAAVRRSAGEAVTARAFAVNIFNLDGDEPALVLGVGNAGGDALERQRDAIYAAVRGSSLYDVAENHTPWIPHVTLAYAERDKIIDAELLTRAARRLGPVTFDRVRVAFGGENVDVPLGPVSGN